MMAEVTEKIRSAEKEADLDRKIEEIRRRNELIEERHKIITEEAKQNGIPKSFQKSSGNIPNNNNTTGGSSNLENKSGSNNSSLKTSETTPSTPNAKKSSLNGNGNGGDSKGNNNQWSREWDRGKTSAEEWKMNVPELGDHGNSYFKTEANVTHIPGGRGRGARGGVHSRGGRRPAPTKNPGFFHDDRYDKTKGEDGKQAPNEGDKSQESAKKPNPAGNRSSPRKPPHHNNPKAENNDKNQNDSNKPNMNISSQNGAGPRRGGSNAPPRHSHQLPRYQSGPYFNHYQSNDKSPVPKESQNNGKMAPKNSNPKKVIENKDDKKQGHSNGVANEKRAPGRDQPRGRGLKTDSHKPANFGNHNRPSNRTPQKSHHQSQPSSKQSGPKLDKDGQNVKRVIDNIIDQVVRHERNELKKLSIQSMDSPDVEGNGDSGSKVDEAKTEPLNDSNVENEATKVEKNEGEVVSLNSEVSEDVEKTEADEAPKEAADEIKNEPTTQESTPEAQKSPEDSSKPSTEAPSSEQPENPSS